MKLHYYCVYISDIYQETEIENIMSLTVDKDVLCSLFKGVQVLFLWYCQKKS